MTGPITAWSAYVDEDGHMRMELAFADETAREDARIVASHFGWREIEGDPEKSGELWVSIDRADR